MISNVFLSPDDLLQRARWYIHLRWFILLAALIPGLLSIYFGYGWNEQFLSTVGVGLVALMTNAIFFILSKFVSNKKTVRILITAIFVIDIALVTGLIYTKGGVESRSVIIYVIPIIMSAAIYGRLGVYAFTLLSVLAYDALILCNYFGLIEALDPVFPGLQRDTAYVVTSMIFYNAMLFLISMAVDFIARLLIQKEHLATQRLNELTRAQSIAMFGSWEWKVGDDRVAWSDELYSIFGLEKTSEPITFERYLTFVHPDDRKQVVEEITKAVKKCKTFSFSHRIITSSGTIRYLHSNGQSYCNKNEEVTHMIGAAHDITESKLLENAKNDFVAVTSHQLRTPATIVKQYATLLQEGYAGELSEDQKAYLKTIYDSNERQISIINDLLNVARIDSGHFNIDTQKIDIVELISKIKKEHVGKYRSKNQRLVFKSAYKKVYCEIDAEQIRMAMENLLDNAHKYTPVKKTVRVALKRRRSYLEITITDQGIGIPAKDVHKIFEMFSRVENPLALQEEGTGIGLYWAKKVVELHGGTVGVASIQGKGTVFTITLPYRVSNR